MSTRCRIGYVREDGKIESIYCHHDGYLEYVGKILRDNYKDTETIKKLMSLGDISSIGRIPESNEDLWDLSLMDNTDSWHELSDKYCCSYNDRGDNTKSSVHNNEKEYLESMYECWGEYAYLFKDGKWSELEHNIEDLNKENI